MKKSTLTIFLAVLFCNGFAQTRYFTKTGTVSFEAGTGVEDIDAINKSAASVFDAASGQFEFAVLVKGFEFKRSLMQEHFNENYVESDKYPKSTFKGKITNLSAVDFKKNGSYTVTVKGTLELHGIKKEVETTGTFKVAGETVIALAEFSVLFDDYKVGIPGVVKDKISKSAKIKVNCNYTILK